MGAPKRVDHLAEAKAILDQQPDDVGDYDLARATAHALVAAGEQLTTIAALIDHERNGPHG